MKRKPVRNSGRNALILLIGVLAVILAAAIGVAFSLGSRQNPDQMTKPNSGDTATLPGETKPTGPRPVTQFSVTASVESGSITVAESVTFTGTSDPAEPMTLNSKPVQRRNDGSFQLNVALETGKNTITITHKGESAVFTYQRQYTVETFSPAGEQSYNSGSTIHFTVSARKGSKVTVTFNGETLTLKKSDNQLGSGIAAGFCLMEGEYSLPKDNVQDRDLGKAVITAACNGITETYETGRIICKKAEGIKTSDPSVTPGYGPYINVGSGYVAEIVNYEAETFNGKTRDDYSHPTNNYLPKGTVDYCSNQVVTTPNGARSYVVLRSGQRVYLTKKNLPSTRKIKIVDRYLSRLPDHNEIHAHSWSQDGHFTVLTLDTLWKAPFRFSVGPQRYAAPDGGSQRDYRISSFTATHIDITFCYATSFSGKVEIPAENPLFQSAEIIRNKSDVTLRLNLKKTGGFYGWQACYNESNQLCFRFLNPAKVSAGDNRYGADLTGIRIMIDVGHGGIDAGATVKGPNGKQYTEADINLDLAFALKKELESIGARVILNRTDDSAIQTEERTQMINREAPDLCIAIHQNSIEGYDYVNGFASYYYNPFSMLAAKKIHEQTKSAGIYRKTEIKWHYYYAARETVCPIVLLENGYMTNAADLKGMLDPATVTAKAGAAARGIVDYFREINR